MKKSFFLIWFIAGLFVGGIFHELGHVVIAKYYGFNIEWGLECPGKWRLRGEPTRYVKRNIASGGFLFEIISSEALIIIPRVISSGFAVGWIVFDIWNPIKYTAFHEVIKRTDVNPNRDLPIGEACFNVKKVKAATGEVEAGHGDLLSIEIGGVNTIYVEIIIVAHAVFIAGRLWRLYRNR